MRLDTKYFGPIDYAPEDVVHFPSGLFGFAEEKEFLLLPFAGSDGNMLCLQSAGTPGLAFIAMNPFSLKPDYAPVLGAEELEVMEVRRSEDLCYYVMCVVRDPVGASTLNCAARWSSTRSCTGACRSSWKKAAMRCVTAWIPCPKGRCRDAGAQPQRGRIRDDRGKYQHHHFVH